MDKPLEEMTRTELMEIVEKSGLEVDLGSGYVPLKRLREIVAEIRNDDSVALASEFDFIEEDEAEEFVEEIEWVTIPGSSARRPKKVLRKKK